MDQILKEVTARMIAYEEGCPKRIQHFLKVHAFAKQIALMEKVDEHTLFILETAALVHDIGIKTADEKYGSHAGPYQETEGAPLAKELLKSVGGYTEEEIERIAYLVGHHHTYKNVEGIDYRILIEADFLVNLYESEVRYKAILAAEENIFETESGKWILHTQFGI